MSEAQHAPEENWGARAEEDLAAAVPHAYLPLWLSLPWWSSVAAGAHYLHPSVISIGAAATAAMVAVVWGIVLRRASAPTLLRFWVACIAAIAAFLVTLLIYINDDSALRLAWGTLLASLAAYTLIMSARRDLLPNHGTRPRE
jgi:hypothetical protein